MNLFYKVSIFLLFIMYLGQTVRYSQKDFRVMSKESIEKFLKIKNNPDPGDEVFAKLLPAITITAVVLFNLWQMMVNTKLIGLNYLKPMAIAVLVLNFRAIYRAFFTVPGIIKSWVENPTEKLGFSDASMAFTRIEGAFCLVFYGLVILKVLGVF